MGRHKCSVKVRRGEKRLTMDKSPAKTVISQIGRHIVNEMDKEIKKIDKKIADLIASDEQLSHVFGIITSTPGIGTQNAVCLMIYTNNFKRFGFNPRKIACYYGIAPFARNSGSSVHCDPHVHYMANRMIKALLTQAALAAVNFCPEIASYYTRLTTAGKKPQVALNNVKNKLIRIITALVRTGSYYSSDYQLSKVSLIS